MKTKRPLSQERKPDEMAIIKTTSGETWDIPEAGSLGLLALGDVGLKMWRQKRYPTTETLPLALKNYFKTTNE